MQTKEINTVQQLLTQHLDIWTTAKTEKKSGRGRTSGNKGSVYGIQKLRELILELAVRGKLVPQDPNDEPASELLKRIQTEKAKLIAEGKLKKEKPLALISEDEKPFELPNTWVWVRITDIGYTQTGTTPNKSEKEAFGNDIPFIKPGDIYPNNVDYENEGLSFKGALNNGRIAPSGSLLMVCIGTIGKCNTIERDCSFNQQINSVTPFHLDSDYLLVACRAEFFQKSCWLNSSSTTLPILNKGKWEQIAIPLPPRAEQYRIVAKVDELMALCDQLENQHLNAEEAHETLVSELLGTLTQSQSAADFNANWQRIYAYFDVLFTTEASIDALKQTLLQLAVMGKLVPQDPNDEPARELLKRIQAEKAKLIAEGKLKKEKPLAPISEDEKPFELPNSWVWVRIADIGYTQTGTTPNKSEMEAFGNDIPFIKPGDIYPNNVDYENEGLSFKGALNNGRVAPSGSLLMVCIGTIGKCNTIERDCSFNQQINSVTPFLLNSYYLLIACRAEFFQKSCWLNSSSTTLPILNKGKWEQITIPLPPLAEQNRIVAKVDELMAMCDQLITRIQQASQQQQLIADALVAQAVG